MSNLLILLIFSAIFITPFSNEAKIIDRVVAIVNNEIITLSDIESVEKNSGLRENRKKILQSLIDERLSQQIIKKLRLSPDSEEVETQINSILKNQGLTKQGLVDFLKQRGMTYKEYKDNIKKSMENERLLEREIKSAISIKDEDLRSYYYSHIKNKKTANTYHVRQLFFPKEKMAIAEKAYKAAQSGESFENIVKNYSDDPSQKESYGDLGFVAEEDLIPPLRKAAKQLKLKEVSKPIVTQAGIHLVQLLAIKKQEEQSYAEVKDNIYKILYEKAFKKILSRWLHMKRQEASIKIVSLEKKTPKKLNIINKE